MSYEASIGGSGTIMLGEDKTLRLEVIDADLSTHDPADETTWIPKDVTGMTLVFIVRDQSSYTGTLLATKSGSVTGSYNAVRASNTQRVLVTLEDTDFVSEAGLIPAGTSYYSLKRTDTGSETVLRHGELIIEETTQA